MFLKVLKAVKQDLCQADEDEILVPNPMVMKDQDNDFFIGIQSRRPARFGRVVALELMTAKALVEQDKLGVIGGSLEDEDDEERVDDLDYYLEVVSELELGSLVSCTYTFEDDEISWEISAVED